MRALCFFLLVAGGFAEPESEKLRPVARVIKLLNDMREQLQAEQEEDQKLYDKMVCWCKNTGTSKRTSIAQADSKSKQLMAQIEELTARSAALKDEIAKGKKEVQANQEALDEAQEVRDKELKEFNDADKSSTETITALKGAIKTLSKHQGLTQVAFTDMTKLMGHLLVGNEKVLGDVAPRVHSMLGLFQQPVAAKSYNSRSGEIFGILEQMLERFESELSDATKDEMAKRDAFDQLRSAKESEISAGYTMVEQKTAERADADSENVAAKQDLKDTNAQLAADREFLADMENKCKRTDEEFNQRVKTRSDEIAAVNEAVGILNSDEAHQAMDKTVNKKMTAANRVTDFLQMGSSHRSMRSAVVAALEKAAQTENPKIMALALSARLDAFTKVKAAIDDMVRELKKQQKDEVDHRDFCRSELATNDQENALAMQNQNKLSLKKDGLEKQIEKLTKELAAANKEVDDTKEAMRRASDDRASANAEFQTTVNDQRASQDILNKAYMRLKQFYDPDTVVAGYNDQQPEAATSMIQQPAPPRGFDDYKKNEGGNSVLNMLKKIIDESKQVEAEAIQDEAEAKQAYESYIKDSNNDVKALLKSIADKTGVKAQADGELVSTEEDLMANLSDLEKLHKYSGELHKSCDFLIANFDTRQAARAQEIEAIGQAKAILSGA